MFKVDASRAVRL